MGVNTAIALETLPVCLCSFTAAYVLHSFTELRRIDRPALLRLLLMMIALGWLLLIGTRSPISVNVKVA